MKKTLFFALCCAFALASCQKMQQAVSIPNAGEEAMATFTVAMTPATKATIDNDGVAANVNRCILEVYSNDKVYRHVETLVDPATLTATFQLPLVISQKYDFLFWADCATQEATGAFTDLYYNTESLKDVKIIEETSGNLDAKDAFFCYDHNVEFTGIASKDYVLTRPFAQVNIVTNDLLEIKNSVDATLSAEELWPAKISVDYTTQFPTHFNVYDGTCSEFKTINRKAEAVYGCETAAANNTLNMDYLFVNATEAPNDPESKDIFAITKAVITLANNSTITILENTENVPIKRNYRTNIIGSFLTDPMDFTVVVNPLWENPDYNPLPTPPSPSEPQGSFWLDEENKEAGAAKGSTIVVFPEGTEKFDMNPDINDVPYNFDVESVTFPASVQEFPAWCMGECKYLHEIVIEGGENCDLSWGSNWLYGVYECNAEGRYIPIEERGHLSITVKNLPKSFATTQNYISCEAGTPDIDIYVPAGWKNAGYYYKFNHGGNGSTTPRKVTVFEDGVQIWPEI